MRSESPAQRPASDPDLLIALDAALLALGRRDREVIGLRYFESLDVPQIAARLHLRPEAAKKRLARAIDRVRRRLSGSSAVAVTTALAALATPSEALAITVSLTAHTPAADAVARGTLAMMKQALLTKAAIAAATIVMLGAGVTGVVLAQQPAPTPLAAPAVAPAAASVGAPAAAPSTAPAASAVETDLEPDWDKLAEGEPQASSALLRLSTKPDEVVALLKQKLAPIALTEAELEPLLEALGSHDDAKWQAASMRLRYFDPRLVVHIEPLMQAFADDPVMSTRLAEVLSGSEPGSFAGKTVRLHKFGDDDAKAYFNFMFETEQGSYTQWAEGRVERLNEIDGSPKPEWTQAVRGITLLEHIGTPDARAIVDAMARGHPDAQPTRVAKAAIATRR